MAHGITQRTQNNFSKCLIAYALLVTGSLDLLHLVAGQRGYFRLHRAP